MANLNAAGIACLLSSRATGTELQSNEKSEDRASMVSQERPHEATHRKGSLVFGVVDAAATQGTASTPVEVTVQGDRGETREATRDTGVASSVITRKRLEAPGLQAQDVLRQQPGVVITESGGFGAPATACIRGATAADTPVYLAGLRLNDDVAGTADLSMIPLWLISRIEIYRGNAPLEADRLGPGGAIFFEPKLPRKPTLGVGYSGGSWGLVRNYAYAGSKQGPVTYLAGFSTERANNRYPYYNDRGMLLAPTDGFIERRKNADSRTLDGWLLGRVDLSHGYTLHWVGNAAWREQGVPRLALLPSRAARQTTERGLGSLSLKGPIGNGKASEFEARFSVVSGRVSYDDPLRELALYTPQLTVQDRRIEQLLAARVEITDRLRVRPTVQWATESIERDPSDIPISHKSRQFGRAGLASELDLTDALALRALINGECHHTGARDKGYCDELLPTGRLGAEVHVGNARFYASGGRYLRVPTLGELYGVSGTVHGNRELVPETGGTADVGVRYAAYPGKVIRKLYLDAFAYARASQGLVAYARTGQGFVRPYNVGRARVTGAEVLVGGRLTDFVGLEVVTTLMDPRDTSPSRQTKNDILPYRSKLIVAPRARADWQRSNASGLNGAGAQLSVVYQSNRYADPAGLVIIDEQTTLDLDGYLLWFDGLLATRARVSNLLDAKRTDIVGYPLPGRSFYLGLEAQY